MDPFDEFEFKPINEGIGFHKKTVQFKKELDVTQSMPSVSLPLKTPLQAPQPQSPVQRPTSPQPGVANPQLPFHEFVERPMDKPKPSPWREQPRAHTGPTPAIRPIEEVNVYLPAIIFDSIVVMGLTCLVAVAVLLVVDVDLINILQIARGDFMTSLSLVLLFLSVLELYLIIFRSFLGSTLGEWAFDIQLGTKTEQASPYYPLRVIWRSVIVIATGFITLPILSLITGRDIAGHLSGLSLKRGESLG
jgi:hypothetical protein